MNRLAQSVIQPIFRQVVFIILVTKGGHNQSSYQLCPYLNLVKISLSRTVSMSNYTLPCVILCSPVKHISRPKGHFVFMKASWSNINRLINSSLNATNVKLYIFNKILLAMIALSDVQSSTWTRIHNAILFIDTSRMLIC